MAALQTCEHLKFAVSSTWISKLTLRFSKFLILCSITVIACLMGVAEVELSAKAVSELICLSILTLAAEGILCVYH